MREGKEDEMNGKKVYVLTSLKKEPGMVSDSHRGADTLMKEEQSLRPAAWNPYEPRGHSAFFTWRCLELSFLEQTLPHRDKEKWSIVSWGSGVV